MDADKDDLYSFNLLLNQHLKNNIKILAIVCDDGFLSYPDNVRITNFWVNDILKATDIKIYRGLDRNSFLKENKNFPKEIIVDYLNEMKDSFGYNDKINPKYYSMNELIELMQDNNELEILTTGNMTTLNNILSNKPNLVKNIKKIYSMIGNYKVDGNLIQEINGPKIFNSEYNSFLDSNSFRNIIKLYHLDIIPLDCTNYIPLNRKIIGQIEDSCKLSNKKINDELIINNFENYIKLLKSTIDTEEGELYMWDSVATLIFLGYDIGQMFTEENIDICWTGKIKEGSNPANIYNHADINKFINNIVDSIL